MKSRAILCLQVVLVAQILSQNEAQNVRRLGKLQEVFAWKQLTYNINGRQVLQDRFSDEDIGDRARRQTDSVVFNSDNEPDRNWTENKLNTGMRRNPFQFQRTTPSSNRRPGRTTTTPRPTTDDPNSFFIQYNNVPMGMERVGNRLFVSIPRRRYGIPATLNYLDLTLDSNERSPGLRPYPNLRESRALTSVYRTRADECGRLWMVDTGMLELPNNQQQLKTPAIVIYDLMTNKQIMQYNLKPSDLPAANTPTGLASITVDIVNGDCGNAFAYIPELTTYGIIVYSLKDNDSWRLSHNYFSFNPTAGNMRIADQSFQWSDGVFSITLTEPRSDGCRTAYFHPMVSTTEFSVSTCVLRNRTASSDPNYYTFYSVVGDRGETSQSTIHGYHAPTRVVFYADMARSAMSCWDSSRPLSPATVAILEQDYTRMVYPSDLHVTGDEVWMMTNFLPRFGYSRLNTDQYNFFIYKGNVQELIAGTVCAGTSPMTASSYMG